MLPKFQSRETYDPLTKRTISLKVFAHGQGVSAPERVVLEIDGSVLVTVRLSVESAAWLGHTLLSAQDDALRMSGPDYDDHKAQEHAEDSFQREEFQQYMDRG